MTLRTRWVCMKDCPVATLITKKDRIFGISMGYFFPVHKPKNTQRYQPLNCWETRTGITRGS